MKKISFLALAFVTLCACLLLASCGEEARGTVWLYGIEEPSDTLEARIGDFYFKTDSFDIYVLEDLGWKVLANVKGEDGQNGANGSNWLYGNKAPSDSDGVDGDFWLNTSALELYKKSSGKWSLIAELNKAD